MLVGFYYVCVVSKLCRSLVNYLMTIAFSVPSLLGVFVCSLRCLLYGLPPNPFLSTTIAYPNLTFCPDFVQAKEPQSCQTTAFS